MHSLRWRLQVWHALILLLVIVGFGTILYFEIERSYWSQVDEELLGAARVLEGSLRSIPRPIIESFAQDLGKNRGPRLPPPDLPGGKDRRPPPHLNPPHNGPNFGGNPRPMQDDRIRPPVQIPWDSQVANAIESLSQEEWETTLSLPRSLPEQFGRGDNPTYFIIWREDHSVLKESAVPESRPVIPSDLETRSRNARYWVQQRGPFHEVLIRGPHLTLIGVGRSVLDEQKRIRHLTLILVSTGSAIFAIGMFGGGWLSRRAIAPIQQMSQTAEAIHSNTLSKRIDLKGFDTELAQLGTVLNSMFDRLNDSFEQQRRFVADASHEMRTPLSVILSSAELGLSRERDPKEYRMQLETCQRSAHRMHQLVESLLMLARLDGNQPNEPTASIDLSKLIDENIKWLEPIASERKVRLVVASQPCFVNGHANLLNQLIANLVVNAIQYNQIGGDVRVELHCDSAWVHLNIEDTGIGIASHDIPHLFERFYRVDQARSRNTGGSGLGLAICHRIVALHGGTIEVESTIGAGSTFKVRLPISFGSAS